jgi:hypothetical protein
MAGFCITKETRHDGDYHEDNQSVSHANAPISVSRMRSYGGFLTQTLQAGATKGTTPKPRNGTDKARALLRLILRRVRQRSLVILDPSEIAGIKPSAVLVATEIVFCLGQSRPGDLPTDDDAARSWLVDWHRDLPRSGDIDCW